MQWELRSINFVYKFRFCWQKRKKLMEVQLFKYRCVVSLKRHFWSYCRLKTKPHPDRASFVFACQPFHRITKTRNVSLLCIEKTVRKCTRQGALISPSPFFPMWWSLLFPEAEVLMCYVLFQHTLQLLVLQQHWWFRELPPKRNKAKPGQSFLYEKSSIINLKFACILKGKLGHSFGVTNLLKIWNNWWYVNGLITLRGS